MSLYLRPEQKLQELKSFLKINNINNCLDIPLKDPNGNSFIVKTIVNNNNIVLTIKYIHQYHYYFDSLPLEINDIIKKYCIDVITTKYQIILPDYYPLKDNPIILLMKPKNNINQSLVSEINSIIYKFNHCNLSDSIFYSSISLQIYMRIFINKIYHLLNNYSVLLDD
jgi:hypothetical protein